MKICLMSDAHHWDDSRVFDLLAKNLSDKDFSVTLIAMERGPKLDKKIKYIKISTKNNHWELYNKATKERADIYHFHDPKFLPWGMLLRFQGKKVIFDAHENYEEKLKSRLVSNKFLKLFRIPLSKIWWIFEKICVSILNGKIVADSTVLKKYGKNTYLLPNVPGKVFYENLPPRQRRNKEFRLIYVGTLSWDRGIVETIEALRYTKYKNVSFHIIGDTQDEKLQEFIKNAPQTVWHGRVPWRQLKNYLVEADVGVVLLQPIDAYLYCPGENIVKLWEYMSVRLPVLISDFPKLKVLCKEIGFGLPVKPDSFQKIAEAIDWLIDHPEERVKFGENGRRAVEEKYNAEIAIEGLIEYYQSLV